LKPMRIHNNENHLKVGVGGSWHAATLFIHFTLIEHTYNIVYILLVGEPISISSLLPLSIKVLLWSAEPGFKLGPALTASRCAAKKSLTIICSPTLAQ
jgi:hypothetical protein